MIHEAGHDARGSWSSKAIKEVRKWRTAQRSISVVQGILTLSQADSISAEKVKEETEPHSMLEVYGGQWKVHVSTKCKKIQMQQAMLPWMIERRQIKASGEEKRTYRNRSRWRRKQNIARHTCSKLTDEKTMCLQSHFMHNMNKRINWHKLHRASRVFAFS